MLTASLFDFFRVGRHCFEVWSHVPEESPKCLSAWDTIRAAMAGETRNPHESEEMDQFKDIVFIPRQRSKHTLSSHWENIYRSRPKAEACDQNVLGAGGRGSTVFGL